MTFVCDAVDQRKHGSDAGHPSVRQSSILSRDSNQINKEGPQATQRQWLLDSNARRIYLCQILHLKVWKALLLGGTLILLFGAQLRELYIPKSGDVAVDVVFMTVFCFFWVDIIIRMDCEINYFHLYLFSSWGYSSGILGSTTTTNNSETLEPDPTFGHCCGRPFHIGSFLFWCDVVSDLALLREIAFVDPGRMFDEARIEIYLNDYGMPLDVSKKHSH